MSIHVVSRKTTLFNIDFKSVIAFFFYQNIYYSNKHRILYSGGELLLNVIVVISGNKIDKPKNNEYCDVDVIF